MNLSELKLKANKIKFILSHHPKILEDIINGRKKIPYNEKLLKSSYLIDIVHMLIKKSLSIDRTTFNLDSRILREKYGTYYNHYINFLLEHKIIRLLSDYCTGKKCKTYYILPHTLKDIRSIKNIDNILLKKYRHTRTIEYLKKLNYKHISYDLMSKIVFNLNRVQIDYVSANEYVRSLKMTDSKYIKNSHSIQCIQNNDLWYTFDGYGRFHSNLTTLKSEIRNKFLMIDNEVTKEIDITNSQPIFLTHLMSKNLDMVDIEEYEFFKRLVIKGKLYKYISKYTVSSNKKDIKKMIYTVLFGTNHLGKKENKLFNKLFPSIFKFIKSYKKLKDDYKALAYELQTSESNLLYNTIIKEVDKKYPGIPFFTIHDSITVKISDYEKVKNIFDENIKKLHENL